MAITQKIDYECKEISCASIVDLGLVATYADTMSKDCRFETV